MRSYPLAFAVSCALWWAIVRAAAGALALIDRFIDVVEHAGSTLGPGVMLPCLLIAGAGSVGLVGLLIRASAWFAVTDRHEVGDSATRL